MPFPRPPMPAVLQQEARKTPTNNALEDSSKTCLNINSCQITLRDRILERIRRCIRHNCRRVSRMGTYSQQLHVPSL